jgi:dCTP deaminase
MTVIPFVLSGIHQSIARTTEEFDAAGGSAGKVVLIKGLDETQPDAPNDANATYDLRIGPTYRDHKNPAQTDLGQDGELKLLPGSAVIVATQEEVRFPKCCFGLIVPKVGLLHRGISNTTSKIDPGYSGRLYVTLFNLGKQNVVLHRGDKFCSLVIFRVGEGARLYDKEMQALRNAEDSSWLSRFWYSVESRTGRWHIALIFLGLLVSGGSLWVAILALLKR